MKKLKLNLDEIKVESFAIPNEKEKIGTVLGAEEPCDTVGSGACGGGGIGTNTWCFGGACQTKDYMYTCQDTCIGAPTCNNTCPNTCQYCPTQIISCHCTDPNYDTACNWWYPSNICI